MTFRFTNRNPVITPDMMTDDPLAVHQKVISNVISPNIFEGVTDFEGTVLEVLTVDSEGSDFWQRTKEFFGYSLPEVPHYICKADFIHDHMPDPRMFTSALEQFEWLKKYPIFEGIPNRAGENSELGLINRGARVKLKFRDTSYRRGQVVELIQANENPESALLFGGALTPKEIYDSVDSPMDVDGSIASFDPTAIDCGKLNPTSIIPTGLKISETVAVGMKYIIPFLPEGARITSSVRSTDDQERIIRNYAATEKRKYGSFPVSDAEMKTPAGLEAARVELGRRGYIIGRVRGDGDPPGDLPEAPHSSYSGHFGGKAFDIAPSRATGQPSLGAISAAVRTIEAEASGLIIDAILIEETNGCVHVEINPSSTFDELVLQTAWYNVTGCSGDPNSIVSNIVANYDVDSKAYLTSDATSKIDMELRTPETSDLNSSVD